MPKPYSMFCLISLIGKQIIVVCFRSLESNFLEIDFLPKPLNCASFLRGYGQNCSDVSLKIEIWRLPHRESHGKEFYLPFYVTEGRSLMFLDNDLLHKSDQLEKMNIIRIPAGSMSLSEEELILKTYTDHVNGSQDKMRT